MALSNSEEKDRKKDRKKDKKKDEKTSGSLTEPLLGGGGGGGGDASEYISSQKGETVSGYAKANIFSLLLFTWLSPLFIFGSKNTIQSEDIPSLAEKDRSKTAFSNFELKWKAQKERAERGKGRGKREETGAVGERGKEGSEESEGKKGEKGLEKDQSVTWSLWDTYKKPIIVTGCLALFKAIIMYAGPTLLNAFVSYSMGERAFPYEGVVLVGALFVAKLLETAAEHQFTFRSLLLGINIRASIIGALYSKTLKLSSKAKQTRTTGEIVNLMSTDAQRLAELCFELHNIWVLPIQIFLALIILFWVVGWAMLAGLGIMFSIFIVNIFVATKAKNFMAALMSAKDKRLKATTEVLNSMKVIKLYGWQDCYEKKVVKLREVEFAELSKYLYLGAVNIFLLWLSPLAVSVATFGCMIYLGYKLTPANVFTAIATFRILQEPLRSFPSVISAVQQALVSVHRLTDFLTAEELQEGSVVRLPFSENPEVAISVENADFSWDEDSETPLLKNLNFEVLRGSRVAICGTVGSGKSSLLSAMFGEMFRHKGSAFISGSVAYVSQVAWIQNGTIQENILFGLPLEEDRYQETLKCTSLKKDLTLFPHGDKTEIGERGINLSGGQKQRIQLARAVYQNCEIYFLDDPFSAVDAHTGTELFENCVMEALGGKTVVLVTHQVEFLPATDLILVLREGEIVQKGEYGNLLSSGTDFSSLVNAHTEAINKVDGVQNVGEIEEDGGVEGQKASQSVEQQNLLENTEKLLEKSVGESEKTEKKKEVSGQLIQDEERESGRVSKEVYWAFLTKALKGIHIPTLLLIQLLWQILQIGSDYWLQFFTSPPLNTKPISTSHFMNVYSLLALGSGIFVLLRSLIVSWAGLETAQVFYKGMLKSIFSAPMSFFDSTPIGRILSRSSTNQSTIDLDLPFSYGSLLAMLFSLMGILFVTSFVTWPIIIAILILGYLYFIIQEYYLLTSRELSRVDGITKAPMIQNFSESISGASTIRAFRHQERFTERNENRVDINSKASFHYYVATDWLGTRLEIIGASFLSLNTMMFIMMPSSWISPGLVGLSLSYSLALNQILFWTVWLWCHIENEMVAVERILQYSELPSEKPLSLPLPPGFPENWPEVGAIEIKNLEIRYRPDLPLVLRDVTFSVEGGQKIGVVGRTGSGKSTLIQVLFRIIEPLQGTVFIDGINICEIGLNDLRRQLSIIPQDPILFEGTIRENLDPLGFYKEDEIWTALDKCQLGEVVRTSGQGLDSPVTENGENWSVGQRQLLCLGRALLKKSKILVLDEATASVDSKTDSMIQKTIKENFVDSTVISIAHRIPTVIDSDMVLVMDGGQVAEYSSPSKLLENKNSLFSKLVSEYSARSSGLTEKARNSSFVKKTA